MLGRNNKIWKETCIECWVSLYESVLNNNPRTYFSCRRSQRWRESKVVLVRFWSLWRRRRNGLRCMCNCAFCCACRRWRHTKRSKLTHYHPIVCNSLQSMLFLLRLFDYYFPRSYLYMFSQANLQPIKLLHQTVAAASLNGQFGCIAVQSL